MTDLIDQGVAEADRRATEEGAGADDRAIASAMAYEATLAKAAVAEFDRRLRQDIVPRAEGEGRLGPDLFQQKLRHTLSSDLSYADLEQRARRDYDLVRAEMLRLAREAWTEWLPGQPLPSSDDDVIRRVLDAVAREHRQPHELLDWSKAEVRRIEEFCRERRVIGLPEEPLEVTWTPVFMRAYGRAFLESPGPLDKGMPSYFWITPPDESAGPQAVESYLREENDRMLRLLAIHEGVPGHYLQLAWANRTPQPRARGIRERDVCRGLGRLRHPGDDGSRLRRLRAGAACSTTGSSTCAPSPTRSWTWPSIPTGMTEEEAMGLMVGGGFQEQDEARGKWLRARLTSTQLSTYYLGSIEMWDMEVEARRRAAARAGTGRRFGTSAAHRRRIGGDAGFRPPGTPRIGHLARNSADQMGQPHPLRRLGPRLMDFGLILPSYREGGSTDSIDAASETAARLGWHSVFTTDHVLVEPSDRSADYFNVFDAVVTVAHVAARQPALRVGISVIVVPMRNAVLLAKELATLDALSGGRLIAGVGVGWNETEFEHVGAGDRFHHRGAYLDEAIALWRHLWRGDEAQFHGQFHQFDEVRFGPLPAQGEDLTIWVGGRDPAALRRAGRLGQGYHSSASGPAQYEPRVPIVRDAAAAGGQGSSRPSRRASAWLSASTKCPSTCSPATPAQMIAELREFERDRRQSRGGRLWRD